MLDEDHQWELQVRDDLQKALERLLTEYEAELESLKAELEIESVGPDVVVSKEEPSGSRRSHSLTRLVFQLLGCCGVPSWSAKRVALRS